jgi:hypothetical protein
VYRSSAGDKFHSRALAARLAEGAAKVAGDRALPRHARRPRFVSRREPKIPR